MPMYDYTCTTCNNTFEELVYSSTVPDEDITCPKCGENKSKRQLCAPMISTKSTSYSPTPSGGCNSSSGFS
ncbi:MAG: zinc ribbon domain-containing protein [Candidatus Marinimicrobia bacterium]|nr:zinc ribbon domain-containing protein [Candidatus Neomarinimicrobiota bacterium]